MIRWRNRGNKYGAVKTVVDGITFDSKAEARRYQELKVLGYSKTDLYIHPKFSISYHGKAICFVVLDFMYKNKDGEFQYEDVKGRDNALSRLKRKLVEAFYDIKVDVISAGSRAGKKNASRPSQPSRQGSPKPDSK